MEVTYHVFKDYKHLKTVGTTDEEIGQGSNGKEAQRLRRLRYSFVCSAYHPARRKLYLTGGYRPYSMIAMPS